MCSLVTLATAQAPTNWKPVGPGGGGALFAPTFSPYNSSELYLSCDMSEQFHTTNLGQSWQTLPWYRVQGGRNAAKVQFTNNPLILYAIDFTDEMQTPVKSTDGGQTWKKLGSDPTGSGCFDLAVDPANSNRVVVCDYSNLYFSSDGGATFKLKIGTTSGSGMHIGGAFFDGSRIVLGTAIGLLGSSDGGSTFKVLPISGIPSTEQIVSFAGSKAGTTTRFFAVTLGAGDVYSGIQGDDHWSYKSVYSLDFPNGTWVKRVSGIPSTAHPFFVGMARSNVSTAYLAGGSTLGLPTILKTTNAGARWSSVLNTVNNANVVTGWQGYQGDRDWTYDELVFGFDVCPTDVNRVIFTGYGFGHLTTDGGASWKQAYVSATTQNPAGQATPKGKPYLSVGLENTTCWDVAWADSNNLWASYADIKGVRSTNGGSTWGFGYSGQNLNASYQAVTHPSTGVMYLATSSVHDLYQSTYLTDARIDGGVGNVLFSADKGKTWQQLGTIGKPVTGVSLDPKNPKRLFAAVANSTVGGIWVCQDITKGASAVWTRLPAPPRTEGHAYGVRVLSDGTLVANYSGRRTTNFTASSGVFVSTNGGQSWVDRSASGMRYWTKDLIVDPTDSTQNTWYACVFGGWGGSANGLGGLYRSTNRGQSWTRVFSNDRVDSAAINPRNANEMYLTTEFDGLLYSGNRKATLPVFTTVSSYPFRHPLRVRFNPYKSEIWVTSFGGGLRVSAASTGP